MSSGTGNESPQPEAGKFSYYEPNVTASVLANVFRVGIDAFKSSRRKRKEKMLNKPFNKNEDYDGFSNSGEQLIEDVRR